MTTVQRTTDNAQTTHGVLFTGLLEMASNSVNRWYELPDAAGRERLERVSIAYMENLAALGVARPTAPKGL